MIRTPLDNKKIAIRDDHGKARLYDVRPLVEQKLVPLDTGDAVILFVDDENKVTDIEVLPTKQK